MLVCIGLQAAAGYYNFEIGVYLQGLFVNTGFYFCMWAVLACVLQTLMPGKWSGMLVVFAVIVTLTALPAFGWNHVLYGFRIPYVIYSDMNGFGHSLQLIYSLVVYWGAFCVLLVLVGHCSPSRRNPARSGISSALAYGVRRRRMDLLQHQYP